MPQTSGPSPRVQREPSWFTTVGADPVARFTLRNARGMAVAVTEWGATLTSVQVPPALAAGAPREILLGWARPGDWEANRAYFGSTVGRVANRVAHGRFQLDGRTVALEANAGPHHLHGGPRGFSHRLWRGTADEGPGVATAAFRLRSAHGDQGWPGNLDVRVRYALDDDNRLTMTWEARTDAPTHVNLTNHAYLNLAGVGPAAAAPSRRPGSATATGGGPATPGRHGTADADGGAGPEPVHDHRLRLYASRYTPTDDAGIPTGQVLPVHGTPLDFTSSRPLGPGLASPAPLVADRGGFDHNVILDGAGTARRSDAGARLHPCARVEHPATGRVLEIRTTLPAVQLYTANGLDEAGTRGGPCGPHTGLCLESQFFPDTPNHPDFPSTRLDPGRVWRHVTTWQLLAGSGSDSP